MARFFDCETRRSCSRVLLCGGIAFRSLPFHPLLQFPTDPESDPTSLHVDQEVGIAGRVAADCADCQTIRLRKRMDFRQQCRGV